MQTVTTTMSSGPLRPALLSQQEITSRSLAAIEQRLLSPMEAIEQRVIDDAQTGLLTLKTERVVEGTAIREGRLSEETC